MARLSEQLVYSGCLLAHHELFGWRRQVHGSTDNVVHIVDVLFDCFARDLHVVVDDEASTTSSTSASVLTDRRRVHRRQHKLIRTNLHRATHVANTGSHMERKVR